MGTLAAMIPRIFRQAWLRYGQPMLYAVKPIADWALPAGYAYDDSVDAIQDGGGTILPNPQSYWAGEYIYIVPIERTADLAVLVAAGVVPMGTVNVYVLAGDAPTVKAAHAVQIDGDWYDVAEVAHAPVGSGGSGLWARVTLKRRS